MERMRKIPGVVHINSSASDAKSILSVRLKREQASDLGVGIQELAGMLPPLVGGEDVAKWSDALGETYDVVVRRPEDQRASAAAIRELMITIPGDDKRGSPRMVRLDQVVHLDLVPGASEIRRLDLTREILISADVSGRAAGDVTADLEALIENRSLRQDIGSSSEEMRKTSKKRPPACSRR